jgi:hypothetical protein
MSAVSLQDGEEKLLSYKAAELEKPAIERCGLERAYLKLVQAYGNRGPMLSSKGVGRHTLGV